MAGKTLSPEERKKYCQIVKPGTILEWFRQMAARKYDSLGTNPPRMPTSTFRRAYDFRLRALV